MVGTIIPMVHGKQQSIRRVRILGLYTFGHLGAGLGVGYFLGTFGRALLKGVSPQVHHLLLLVVSGFVGLLYSSRELGFVRVPIPEFRRQVPQRWRATLSHEKSSLFYGLALGTGIGTH